MGEMADAIGFFDGFQAQRSNGLGKGSAGSRVGGFGMICQLAAVLSLPAVEKNPRARQIAINTENLHARSRQDQSARGR
jgi:hypothetical protein